jgi:hypothetical protein
MKFAKVVFWVASIWGVLVLTPLLFMFDVIGRKDPPPITHPGFYYGFICVALVFHSVFAVIATDPMRFRPMMIPAILEKLTYVTTVVLLVLQQRMHASDMAFAVTDFLLGLLFVAAFLKTRPGDGVPLRR